jgi:hypothetical protein
LRGGVRHGRAQQRSGQKVNAGGAHAAAAQGSPGGKGVPPRLTISSMVVCAVHAVQNPTAHTAPNRQLRRKTSIRPLLRVAGYGTEIAQSLFRGRGGRKSAFLAITGPYKLSGHKPRRPMPSRADFQPVRVHLLRDRQFLVNKQQICGVRAPCRAVQQAGGNN